MPISLLDSCICNVLSELINNILTCWQYDLDWLFVVLKSTLKANHIDSFTSLVLLFWFYFYNPDQSSTLTPLSRVRSVSGVHVFSLCESRGRRGWTLSFSAPWKAGFLWTSDHIKRVYCNTSHDVHIKSDDCLISDVVQLSAAARRLPHPHEHTLRHSCGTDCLPGYVLLLYSRRSATVSRPRSVSVSLSHTVGWHVWEVAGSNPR